jgi:hypothetical protein
MHLLAKLERDFQRLSILDLDVDETRRTPQYKTLLIAQIHQTLPQTTKMRTAVHVHEHRNGSLR